MRRMLGLLVMLAVGLSVMALGGCGGATDDVARDAPVPGSTGATTPGPAQPVPEGEVSTTGLATVLERDGGAELCLGPVAESYPPQCSGPPIDNWDWDGLGSGMFEHANGVRWGQYAVTGTWDGRTFHVSAAVPSALYDPAAISPSPEPPPARTYPAAELEGIVQDLPGLLPGVLTAASTNGGQVPTQVVYDDGSLQRWADRRYGEHVVLVTSALTARNPDLPDPG